MARLPQKQQYMGTSRTFANPTTPEGVSLSSPRRKHKRRDLSAGRASPILATSTYQTRSHYTLNSPALYWNLPPPIWNLDDNGNALEPPVPRKKPKRCRGKQQPLLQHSQTHATFCHDPLCAFHC